MNTSRKQLSVQLWTLREELGANPGATFKAVADIGYDAVELWFQDWPRAGEVRSMAADAGLAISGAHVLFKELRDNTSKVFDWHEEAGNRNLIVPHIPADLRKDAGDWRQRVEEIAIIAQRCREAGFTLSYHNHDVEFIDTIDGEEIQDFIYRMIPAALLKAQIDTYFVKRVGKDPAPYLAKYADRTLAVHLKDQSRADGMMTAPVGEGTINWDEVLPAALATTAQWLVVEDNCQAGGGLESVRKSHDFLRERLAALKAPS